MKQWAYPPELQVINRHIGELTYLKPNPGQWPGEQGNCPKHGEDGLTWAFEDRHIADMSWHCWPCLLEYVRGLVDALMFAEAELDTAHGLWAIDKKPDDADAFQLDFLDCLTAVREAKRFIVEQEITA